MSERKEFTILVRQSQDGGWVASCSEMPGYTAEGDTAGEARAELIRALEHVAKTRHWDLYVIKPPEVKWTWTIQFADEEPVSYGDQPESMSATAREYEIA